MCSLYADYAKKRGVARIFTPNQEAEICEIYRSTRITADELAEKYGCSRRTIFYTLNPASRRSKGGRK